MASPSPKRKVEVRFCWLLLAAGCCWLLLAAATDPGALLSPHAMPPGPPPCFGRDTSPWTAQHKNFLPRPRHSKEWPADSLGAGGA